MAQNEIFQVLSKIVAWNFSDCMHEVIVAQQPKIDLTLPVTVPVEHKK